MSDSAFSPQVDQLSRLRKGEACMYCRRRKMKCDAGRPICGQCTRGNRPDDCEYASSSGYSRTQTLEDTIARLEVRIRELEEPAEDAGVAAIGVALTHPYADASEASDFQLPSNQDILLPNNVGITTPEQPISLFGAWSGHGEPPAQAALTLIDTFLCHADHLGFFLHEGRFRDSISTAPHNAAFRPAPSLIAVVYLWGTKLVGSPNTTALESVLLDVSLKAISESLSGDHPNKALHTIQAEILLATYFFTAGRLLEGRYHISTAMALALASGLNKIRSADGRTGGALSQLPAPRDSIEEGERIRGWWMLFILDQSWAAALDTSPHMPWPMDGTGTQLDTPWPQDIADYEQPASGNNRTRSTICTFMNGTQAMDSGNSALALLAQAAFLWERARNLMSNEWRPDFNSEELRGFTQRLFAIDARISQVTQALTASWVGDNAHVVAARCIVNAAAIKLHAGLANATNFSRNKCLFAAQAIVMSLSLLADAFRMSPDRAVNPVLGSTWACACQVLLNDLRLSSVSSTFNTVQGDIREVIASGINAMEVLSGGSALIAYQVDLTKQAYLNSIS
ncbi:hypothetical protein HGRIS_010357 [Hohenbuehelia grisea]|uniref:Zn(2)-C6 fungal-type domain-containing protein n=1 Tax=Hohenbuehelia grisea TaxID=104357 RepID=A0ABR3J426_9AGAR